MRIGSSCSRNLVPEIDFEKRSGMILVAQKPKQQRLSFFEAEAVSENLIRNQLFFYFLILLARFSSRIQFRLTIPETVQLDELRAALAERKKQSLTSRNLCSKTLAPPSSDALPTARELRSKLRSCARTSVSMAGNANCTAGLGGGRSPAPGENRGGGAGSSCGAHCTVAYLTACFAATR